MSIYIFAGAMLFMVILLLILCQQLSDINEMLEADLKNTLKKLKSRNIPDNILKICRNCGDSYEKQKVADENFIDDLVKEIKRLNGM